MIDIKVLKTDKHLLQVQELWKQNASRLGFFPKGAFEEHKNKKLIIIAVDEKDECLGYLLYRITKNKTAITHLCVDENKRGQGIAKKLVDFLIQQTKHTAGIILKCREDYFGTHIWEKFGFTYSTHSAGRGKESKKLITWWRGNGEPDLFTATAKKLQQEKISAVIDANILFEFDEPIKENNIPTLLLKDSWIDDDIELFLTPEIRNEILRNKDDSKQSKNKTHAQSFFQADCSTLKFDKILSELNTLFPEKLSSPRDISDLKHIAWTIGFGAEYFITNDENLILSTSELLEENYGLKILRPGELIRKIHELLKRKNYEPSRFIGTTLKYTLAKSEEIDRLIKIFQNTCLERKNQFRETIQLIISKPDKYLLHVITEDNNPIGIIAKSVPQKDDYEIEIPVFRVIENTKGFTLAQQLVRDCIRYSIEKQKSITRISDYNINKNVGENLYKFGFFGSLNGYVKINLPFIMNSTQITEKILEQHSKIKVEYKGIEEWGNLIKDQDNIKNPVFIANQESYLFPLKIKDGQIPCYLIPIQPKWAEELFDEKMASMGLFGRKTELALNDTLVYYRSAKGPTISSPARILWYVSGTEMGHSKHVRACSLLEDVEINKPKELFRKYKRFGIYSWENVYQTAKNNINNDIMVLKFTNTELLKKPIKLKRLINIFLEGSQRYQIQQPQPIKSDVFMKIYEEGMI
jgi:predicted GNAT family acetyltransferase/predicted nucleic acid-binding protein